MAKPSLTYEPSPKHCEPITAEAPGTKCPAWSAAVADALLAKSTLIGKKRYATQDGVAFVGQLTRATDGVEIWHGYPEAWDRIDMKLKRGWLKSGAITRRDLRRLATRAQVVGQFGGRL